MTAKGKALPPVAAIVLAAGGSTRMGKAKQLLPIDGQPMIRRVTLAVCAAELAQIVVVVGAQAPEVERALVGLPIEVVINDAWAGGLSTSVRTGLGTLDSRIQAAIMVLADQPALTSHLLRDLVARYQATGASIVAPCYRGRRGNPVLFDRSLFPELAAVEGDRGGRELLARDQAAIEWVEVDDETILADVDTWQDYTMVQESRET